MSHRWIADRMSLFDSSGIRRVFDLAARLERPIDLSIGQPDFDVPPEIQEAAIRAIRDGRNGYAPTMGIPELRDALAQRIQADYDHADRQVFVTSGTAGGLLLAVMALVDPGDEVIIFDPAFLVYQAIVSVVGGRVVPVDTYPDFRLDIDRVREVITERTKLILFNSPANPTGAVAGETEVRALAELAAERDIALVSDEIYRAFCHVPFVSPAQFNDQTIVVDGFSKTYAITGWRLAFAHGPAAIIDEMAKLQQYTFVCAPQPAQWAGVAALEVDVRPYVADYRRKRDLLIDELDGVLEMEKPEGAFYAFPKAPWGTGTEFVERAIQQQLLVIPGGIFSGRDTHFRISYAVADDTIRRGAEVLRSLASQGP